MTTTLPSGYLDSSDDEHPDADGDDTNGHQVALETGRTTIKVEVTSEDEKATHTYTVGVSRPGTPGRPTVSASNLVAGDASLTVSWMAPDQYRRHRNPDRLLRPIAT